MYHSQRLLRRSQSPFLLYSQRTFSSGPSGTQLEGASIKRRTTTTVRPSLTFPISFSAVWVVPPTSFARFCVCACMCLRLWRLTENAVSTPPGSSARAYRGTRPAGAAGPGLFADCDGGISIGTGCEGQGRAGRTVQGVRGASFSAFGQGACRMSYPFMLTQR